MSADTLFLFAALPCVNLSFQKRTGRSMTNTHILFSISGSDTEGADAGPMIWQVCGA
jgi:hypothetical protein